MTNKKVIDKLEQGISSSLGILEQTRKFIMQQDFGSKPKDLLAVTESLTCIYNDLEFCQSLIDKYKK